jgi:hypothetical protein
VQSCIAEAVKEYESVRAGLKYFTAGELRVKMIPGIGCTFHFDLSGSGFTGGHDDPMHRHAFLSGRR